MQVLSGFASAVVPAPWVVLILVVMLAFVVPWQKIPLAFFAAGAVALVYLVHGLVSPDVRWGWVLALLPPALVIQHAAYLSLFRARYVPSDDERLEAAFEEAPEHLRPALRSASISNQRFFGASALVLRYCIPALLLGIAGVAILYALFVRASFPSLSIASNPKVALFCSAARYGAAGAYTYVVLYLGRRTFQQDITSGAVNWSAVNLAIGPIVAGLLALVTTGDSMTWGTGSLSTGGLYFVAGFSPTYIVAAISAVVEKAFPGEKSKVEDRTVSLLLVRGINANIVERLGEEGIQDATALAMCDPHRLLRNTPYPKQLILCWVDEALLMWAFPERWKEIESLGITGAVDLAWVAQFISPESRKTDGPSLAALAEKTGLAADVLVGALQRLFEDAQVQLVWALYQLEGSEVAPSAGAAADAANQQTTASNPAPNARSERPRTEGDDMRGFIDIERPEPASPHPDPRAVLDREKATPNRALCLVFGTGADADAVVGKAADAASKTECARVRVLRVRNDAVLRADEAEWKHVTGNGVTLLQFDQAVSKKMTLTEASDDGDLFNAMVDAVAGRATA